MTAWRVGPSRIRDQTPCLLLAGGCLTLGTREALNTAFKGILKLHLPTACPLGARTPPPCISLLPGVPFLSPQGDTSPFPGGNWPVGQGLSGHGRARTLSGLTGLLGCSACPLPLSLAWAASCLDCSAQVSASRGWRGSLADLRTVFLCSCLLSRSSGPPVLAFLASAKSGSLCVNSGNPRCVQALLGWTLRARADRPFLLRDQYPVQPVAQHLRVLFHITICLR